MTESQRNILRDMAGGARLISVVGSPECYVLGPDVYRPVDIDDCSALDDAGYLKFLYIQGVAAYSTLTPAGAAAAAGEGAK